MEPGATVSTHTQYKMEWCRQTKYVQIERAASGSACGSENMQENSQTRLCVCVLVCVCFISSQRVMAQNHKSQHKLQLLF